jgi:uncharacterized membrane protein (DUF373 family)
MPAFTGPEPDWVTSRPLCVVHRALGQISRRAVTRRASSRAGTIVRRPRPRNEPNRNLISAGETMEAPEVRKSTAEGRWIRILAVFESIIIFLLVSLLMIVVVFSTAEFAWLLLRDLLSMRGLLLDVEETFELFGYFLLVLIGVDLLSSFKTYVRERIIHMDVVLEVALIAIAQKIIVMNIPHSDGLSLLGIAAMIGALAVAFRWARGMRIDPNRHSR